MLQECKLQPEIKVFEISMINDLLENNSQLLLLGDLIHVLQF